MAKKVRSVPKNKLPIAECTSCHIRETHEDFLMPKGWLVLTDARKTNDSNKLIDLDFCSIKCLKTWTLSQETK